MLNPTFNVNQVSPRKQANDRNNALGSQLIEHYKDTPYVDILNPYAQQLSNYKRGFLDRLGDLFGFATREDTLTNSALEYDSQISQLKFENEYNSESAKSARMREAGVNPDLLGTSGVSESSGFDMTQTSPDLNAGWDVVGGFASSMMSIVGMSIDVASKFVGLQDQVASLDAKDLSNGANALGIADHLQRVFLGTGSDIQSITFNPSTRSFGTLDDAGRFIPFMNIPVNRRNFNRVRNFLRSNGYDVNVMNDYWNGMRSAHSNRDQYARGASSVFSEPLTPNDNTHQQFSALQDVVEPLQELTDNLLKSEVKSKKSDFDYNTDYRSNLNGFISAEAENNENTERSNAANQKSQVMSTFREIISNLSETASDPKASKVDKAFANAALLIIPAVLSKIGM